MTAVNAPHSTAEPSAAELAQRSARDEGRPLDDRALRDRFGRSIQYLRISVTDRCNFRCLYCMPVEGLAWLPKNEILSYEEIASVVTQLAPLGLRRLRLTGGEPTLRPPGQRLVGVLRGLPQGQGHPPSA